MQYTQSNCNILHLCIDYTFILDIQFILASNGYNSLLYKTLDFSAGGRIWNIVFLFEIIPDAAKPIKAPKINKYKRSFKKNCIS